MNELELNQLHRSFTDLSEASLDVLAEYADQRHYEAGRVIFEGDGSADEFYVIRSGTVTLEMPSPGREPLVVETIGPGELLGVSWAFPPYRWNWRARAQSDVELVAFDAERVREGIRDDPVLRTALLEAVATEAVDRLHATRMRLLDIYRATP